MIMLFGVAAFIVMAGLSLLGVIIVFASAGFMFVPRFRKPSLMVFAGSFAGAAFGMIAFSLLQFMLGGKVAIVGLLLFGGAGLGVGSTLTLLVVVMVTLLGQPTNWSRRRKVNA